MGSENKTFYWISHRVFNGFDEINNVLYNLNIECGFDCSKKDFKVFFPSRISLKFQDNNTQKNNLSFEFDLIMARKLINLIKDNDNKDTYLISLVSTDKNKIKKINISTLQHGYTIEIVDPKSLTNQISCFFDKHIFLTFYEIVREFYEDFLKINLKFSSLLMQEHINDVNIKIGKSLKVETNNTQNVLKEVLIPYVQNQSIENSSDLLDSITTYPDFSHSNETIIVNLNESDIIKNDNTSNESVDENLSGLFDQLSKENLKQTKLTDYEKAIKPEIKIDDFNNTNFLFPMLENVFNWDIKRLQQWIDISILANENSDETSFVPLEMMFQKALSHESFNIIKNTKHFYTFQFYLLNILKNEALNMLNDKKVNYDFVFDFDKVYVNNQDLIFVIKDINLLFTSFSLFKHFIDKMDSNVKTHHNYFEIIKVYNFLKYTLIYLYSFIDPTSEKKSEIYKLVETDIEKFIKSEIYNQLCNIFSDITLGGKFLLTFENMSKMSSTFLKYVDNMFQKGSVISLDNINDLNIKFGFKTIHFMLNSSKDIQKIMFETFNNLSEKSKIESQKKDEQTSVNLNTKNISYNDLEHFILSN